LLLAGRLRWLAARRWLAVLDGCAALAALRWLVALAGWLRWLAGCAG